MTYQYLQHDGFVYRRPVPPEDNFFDVKRWGEIEIWNGRAWQKPITNDIAMQPIYYGSEITAEDARAYTGEVETKA